MARVSHDPGLLQAALYGYQMEKEKIDAKIRDLQAQLKGKKAPVAAAAKPAKSGGRRQMSDAARARIAAAQKKRWAEFHKKKTSAQGGD
jgi:Skp family chaperone for outer membrane proteins